MLKRIYLAMIFGRQKSALSRLSDKQLKDIGISRGEIHSIAHRLVYGDQAAV